MPRPGTFGSSRGWSATSTSIGRFDMELHRAIHHTNIGPRDTGALPNHILSRDRGRRTAGEGHPGVAAG